MKTLPLETNLLRTFRFFLWVQFALLLVNVLAHARHTYLNNDPWLTLVTGGGVIFLLQGYLSSDWLRQKLGRFYLPLAIILSAAFSLIMQNVFLLRPPSASDGSSEETAWTLFLFLFIPLVLTGWQYNFRAVIIYCIFITFFEAALAALIAPSSLTNEVYPRLLIIRAVAFLIAGYIVSTIMRQFREQRASLEKANAELTHYAATLEQLTISQERNRLARELHDTLAHTLSGMAVQLEAVQSLWDDSPAEARSMLGKSLTATRSGLTETRRALQALRASPLEDLGLALALRNLAETTTLRASLTLDWQVAETLPKLPPDVEQGIYRIAQEAFQNIARHAAAKSVRVTWEKRPGQMILSIRDDGRGFAPVETPTDQHYGLRGMRERAQMLGGELNVISQPGQGVEIQLILKV